MSKETAEGKEKTMFCPNCGQKLREGARFCGSCGNRIDANGQSFQPEQAGKQDGPREQSKAEEEAGAANNIPVAGLESNQPKVKPRKGVKKQTKIIITAVICTVIAIAAVVAVTQFSREIAVSSIDPSNVPVNETDYGFEVDGSTPILPAEEGLPQSITQISKIMATEPSQLPSFIDSQNGSATTNSSGITDKSTLSYEIELNSAIRAKMDPNTVFLDAKCSQVKVDLTGVTASDLSKNTQPGVIRVSFNSKWFTDDMMSYFIKVNDLSYASTKAASEDGLSQAYCGCFTIGEDTYYWVLTQCRFSQDAKPSKIATTLSCCQANWAVGTLENLADGTYYNAQDVAKMNSGHYISSKFAKAWRDEDHGYVTAQ